MERIPKFEVSSQGNPEEQTAVALKEADTVQSKILESADKEDIADYLFDQYMKQQLLEDFFDTLGDYLDADHIDRMRGTLAACEDDNDVYAALSLPRELRERYFSDFAKKIESGEATPEALMQQLLAVSKRHGFSIGYHTSPHDINPDTDGRWTIRGTEKDHRDGDRTQAYYSTKYRHLFKNKAPKFIYIVRTEPQTHKTDGNWSRAGSLSIVSKVPFQDVFEYVENTARTKQKQNGTANGDGRPS